MIFKTYKIRGVEIKALENPINYCMNIFKVVLFFYFHSLRPSQQFLVMSDGTSMLELILSKDKCVFSSAQHSDASEVRTCGPSVSSPALYH